MKAVPADDQIKKNVSILCGNPWDISARPMEPFSESAISFLSAAGRLLMHDERAKAYPDVVTFAFFCRRARLEELSGEYRSSEKDPSVSRIGRGLIFHIAPSNVPVNFAYSLATGLLAGNANIVKVSSKDFEQARIICSAFKKVIESDMPEFESCVNVIMYDRDRSDITDYFSSVCNGRVIWGGDETVFNIRKSSLPPRAVEVTFADRYSLAVISARKVCSISGDMDAIRRLSQDFYNDTYLFDQNACTSPHLLYWLGDEEEVTCARKIFWDGIYENIRERYHIEGVTEADKKTAVCRSALELDGARLIPGPDEKIVRVSIDRLSRKLSEIRAPGGFFHEYRDKTVEALSDIVDERFQTVAVYGDEKITRSIRDLVLRKGLTGIDRIVPIGHTADFDFHWDGYDLIRTLSREIISL